MHIFTLLYLMKKYSDLIILALLTIFFISSFFIYKFIYIHPFNQDEFQHTHIAWNVYNSKIIYKDFFEHHGPLYALINGKIILQMLNNPASIDTLFLLRKFSFFTYFFIVALIFLLCHSFVKEQNECVRKLSPFFSITIFSLWYVVHKQIFSIRPDIYQVFFMLLGFLLVFYSLDFKKYRRIFLILAGSAFGLMLLCNFKTILIFIILLIVYLLEAFEKKNFECFT